MDGMTNLASMKKHLKNFGMSGWELNKKSLLFLWNAQKNKEAGTFPASRENGV